ncbi:hypothetical protein Ctha_1474 [Chloroherpeton thalassium ATCC 35110]|uniref:Uncharacterized protein n=1 Tax=Chloroherpeton thalassium (strain ATCC 35110 / GB-78) TaxID=517418 RepID=B3QRY0_CHLT3|nr:ABC transporter permease [Chloroherpeton thalassium]ACF13933.1 hypothetical protein Ctha_1474 [Chloroherpeton thalassium ATCC 35110]
MNIKELFLIELIKVQKRKAFWVTVGFYAFFGAIFLWIISQGSFSVNSEIYQGFSLPNDWMSVLGQFKLFSIIYLPVTIILLSSDEFANRTARQNIIDGLTREDYFLSKLILVFFISAVYLLLFIGLGLAVASFKQAVSHNAIRLLEINLFTSYFVLLIGYGTLALFFSFLAQNTANALVFYLLYLFLETIAAPLLSLKEATAQIPMYLPTNVFDTLIDASRFAANEVFQSTDAGKLSTLFAWTFALIYIAAINGAAFYSFKSRDL